MEPMFEKGQRVTATLEKKDSTVTYTGTVESQKRGWVMVNLEAPTTTTAGWDTNLLMVRSSDLTLLPPLA